MDQDRSEDKAVNNAVYLSTGAFIGRINGRNPHLLTAYAGAFRCDGFELLMFDEFYGDWPAIAAEYRGAGIAIPVVHCAKGVGERLSGGPAEVEEAYRLFERNCAAAAGVGAGKLVLHAWGWPGSDAEPERLYAQAGRLLELAAPYGIDLLAENISCTHGSPLAHLEAMAARYPALGFIIDTRHAQFHRELAATCNSGIWPSVRHIHINDYHGGYRDWDARLPILQPGEGDVDWTGFFRHLRASGYAGSVTLEAPSIQENGVDAATLNDSLRFIREMLE